MTVQPPPPPPPPPASGGAGLPPWAMYAGGAVLALVVAGFGFGWFGGGGDATAAPDDTGPLVTLEGDSTTTSEATSTTAGDTTTSEATTTSSTTTSSTTSSTTTSTSTTTTSSTTTTTLSPYLLEEDFTSGESASFPLFGPEFMEIVFQQGEMEIWANFAGILPAMYPDPYPDSEITMVFDKDQSNPNAVFGAIVLAEDPSDFVIEHFVLVYVHPDANTIGAYALQGGEFGQDVSVQIPPAAGFDALGPNELRMVVSGSSVDIYLNDVFAVTWSGTATAAPGWFGPVVVGGEDDDGDGQLVFPDILRVDYVSVEALAG